ncbi:MAG: type VI secretion system tube protein Hcp [Algicola sp.]|nr:type VI secretion system tube protein Hcp [Algicola sp.]
MDLILLQFGSAVFTKSDGKLAGISGASLIDGEEGPNWNTYEDPSFDASKNIELVSINQGIQQQVTTDVSNSSRTSGRPIITDFTCVKYVDITSPKMYDHCLRAKPIDIGMLEPTVIRVLRNSGDRLNEIMRFELRFAIISEIQFQSHPNDMSTEQFKLNFTEITWRHQVQGASVINKGFSAAGWSIAKNRPIGSLSD